MGLKKEQVCKKIGNLLYQYNRVKFIVRFEGMEELPLFEKKEELDIEYAVNFYVGLTRTTKSGNYSNDSIAFHNFVYDRENNYFFALDNTDSWSRVVNEVKRGKNYVSPNVPRIDVGFTFTYSSFNKYTEMVNLFSKYKWGIGKNPNHFNFYVQNGLYSITTDTLANEEVESSFDKFFKIEGSTITLTIPVELKQ